MRSTSAVLTACMAAAALAACEPTTRTPQNVAGTWVQVELNDKPLPARFESEFQGRVCVNEMVHNDLQLRPDGTYESTGQVRTGCAPEGAPLELRAQPFRSGGTYELEGPRGTTIRLETPSATPNTPAAPSVWGVFDGNELVLTLEDPVTGTAQTARHVKD